MYLSMENRFKLTPAYQQFSLNCGASKKQTPIKIMASNKTTKKTATKSSAKDLRATKGQADKVKGGMLGPSA